MASRAEVRPTCLWLASLAADQRGPIARLVRRYGSFEAALARPREELETFLQRLPQEKLDGGDGEFVGAVVAWCDEDYPPQLREIYDPPAALYVRGAAPVPVLAKLRDHPVVAIVGSRGPSPYGLDMTRALAADLAAAGTIVVSGLATGIDAAAHRAVVQEDDRVGDPQSGPPPVGVLGCGADVVYPMTNRRLFGEVAHRGLLVSEYYWGVAAAPWRFPARNRIIAGLSHAVVIVEGAERSGALITAEFALELGREVFAVPGEAGRRLSAGPHKLLREGAHLCESATDVLDVFPAWRDAVAGLSRGCIGPETQRQLTDVAGAGTHTEHANQKGESLKQRLLSVLDAGESSIDELTVRTDCPVAGVTVALSELEVEGRVRPTGGGRFRIVRTARR